MPDTPHDPPARKGRSVALGATVKRAGWTAVGVAFGAFAGRALGGALLGRLGADVGEVAGAAAGGWWAWEAAGEAPASGEAGAPGAPSAARGDEALVEASAVDASIAP